MKLENNVPELEPAKDLYDRLYDDNFKSVFDKVKTLYKSMKSEFHPISNEDLEWIITMLPLELYNAAESLNKLILFSEVMKLKLKELKSSKDKDISNKISEIHVAKIVYDTVISRIQNEITFSKELIMGAKKIWDSRQESTKSNPISEITDLPEYKQQYIK